MEELSSVKDSVIFGLHIQGLMGEVGGPSGQLVVPNMEPIKVYMVVQNTEKEKMALAANKNEEKGQLQMDPIIETS